MRQRFGYLEPLLVRVDDDRDSLALCLYDRIELCEMVKRIDYFVAFVPFSHVVGFR